jgi:hypothetical protein
MQQHPQGWTDDATMLVLPEAHQIESFEALQLAAANPEGQYHQPVV